MAPERPSLQRLDRPKWDLLARRGGPVRIAGLGGSMRPFIRSEDTVVLVPLGEARLRLGDVVLLDAGRRGLMLHRVVRVEGDRYLIKGDGNPVPDGWFGREAVLARAVALERPGRRPRNLLRRREHALARLVAWGSPHSDTLRKLGRPIRTLVRRLLRAR